MTEKQELRCEELLSYDWGFSHRLDEVIIGTYISNKADHSS